MANSIGILYPFRECTINSKSITHMHREFTIRFLESLWIHYLFREFTMKLYREFGLNQFSLSLPFNPLSPSAIYYENTIYLAILRWTHYNFRWFTINSLSVSRMKYEFTIFSRIDLKSNIVFVNSLSFSSIHYLFREFTIYFTKFPWIHNLHRDFSLNSPSFSRIHYLFRELSIN